MSVYESNFVRLGGLIDRVDSVTGVHRSTSDQDLPLHLTVIDRTRYTCTLHLTYWFDDNDAPLRRPPAELPAPGAEIAGALADPDLRLKMYFDGQLAEVMSLAAGHRHAFLLDIAASHKEALDVRWRRNMMLNKWLEYVSDCGHHFD
ncbi:MAG: DUF1249 domain-containing protein [Pseudomonadota bacterium]